MTNPEIEIGGVKITLTDGQLASIDKQRNKKTIPVFERVNSMEDVYEECGFPRDFKLDVSVFPERFQKHQEGLFNIMLIAEVFNEGWVDDFFNKDQQKWAPIHNHTPSGFVFDFSYCTWALTASSVGSRRCFKNEATSNHVGKKFIEEFKKLNSR